MKHWENLKENRCPMCGYDLSKEIGGDCLNNKCDFTISKKKAVKLVDDLNREDMAKEMEGYGLE